MGSNRFFSFIERVRERERGTDREREREAETEREKGKLHTLLHMHRWNGSRSLIRTNYNYHAATATFFWTCNLAILLKVSIMRPQRTYTPHLQLWAFESWLRYCWLRFPNYYLPSRKHGGKKNNRPPRPDTFSTYARFTIQDIPLRCTTIDNVGYQRGHVSVNIIAHASSCKWCIPFGMAGVAIQCFTLNRFYFLAVGAISLCIAAPPMEKNWNPSAAEFHFNLVSIALSTFGKYQLGNGASHVSHYMDVCAMYTYIFIGGYGRWYIYRCVHGMTCRRHITHKLALSQLFFRTKRSNKEGQLSFGNIRILLLLNSYYSSHAKKCQVNMWYVHAYAYASNWQTW